MSNTNKDHWSEEKYKNAADFVHKLTTTVVSYLDVQPADHILDIGCGDGPLTAQLAQRAYSGKVLGLDASESFIKTAQQKYTSDNISFELQDCTDLGNSPETVNGAWDKVFSNAAMHWILRKESTRIPFFKHIYSALKPGGLFAFEMGGKGNVAEIDTAFASAMMHVGVPIERFYEVRPWFFPSVEWMRKTLTDAGFEVEKCELEYRPTKLNPDTADKSGGIEGWLRLMGAQFLEAVPEEKREDVLREVMASIDHVITRDEDGSRWIGYVRLRAAARKKW